MVLFYFSGTGNSEYLAKFFCREMGANCHSIEEAVDFHALITSNDVIGFCYPIYGSRLPRNMRQFVDRHVEELKGKKLIIFATQWAFSGDGARVLTDLLPKGHGEVIYAEHFNMPNNINNTALFKEVKKKKMEAKIARAERKMLIACENIKAGIIKRRGFSPISKFFGSFQGVFWQRKSDSVELVPGSMEAKIARSVRIDDACVVCSICVTACPVDNLSLEKDRINHHNDCVGCFRCVNVCPQRSISVMSKKMPKWQYGCVKKID